MSQRIRPYPEYKDSGVPWLGKIPIHWKLARLKSLLNERSTKGYPNEPMLAATQTKGVIRKDQYENRTVIAQKDLHLLKLVRIGDFVISLRSFQGGIEYAREQGIISPAYTILYSKNPSNHDYLARLFKSKPFIDNLSLHVTGIREGQNIDYEKLSRSFIPLPPHDEQTAIVRYLDFIDRRIRRYIQSRQKMIKLLNEQKQAIIHQAVTRGLDPNVRLKPSGVEWLGDVPEHWDIIRLRQLSESLQTGPFGSQLHSEEYISGGIPIINPSHMSNGEVIPSEEQTVTPEKWEGLKRHAVTTGDIVFARRGELGRCALITEKESGWLCGTGSIKMSPKNGMIDGRYLVILCSLNQIGDFLTLESVGSTMDNLNPSRLGRLLLPVPPLSEQKKMVKQIEIISTQINNACDVITKQISRIKEYKDQLVTDVITGKVDVRPFSISLSERELDLQDKDSELVEEITGIISTDKEKILDEN